MAWAHVQGAGVGNGTSVTLSSNVTVGNLVVVGVSRFTHSNAPTCSDNLGNTWVRAGLQWGNGSAMTLIFYSVVTTGGSMTVTVTNLGFSCVAADEFSGVPSPLYLNAAVGGQGTSNAPSVGTAAVSGSSLVYAVVDADGSTTYAAGSGFTLGFTYPYGTPDGIATEYLLNASTNQAPSFAFGSSVPWAMSAVSFGPSPPAAGTWTHRQGRANYTFTESPVQMAAPVVVGNLVVVGMASNVDASTMSLSDNLGNSWTKVVGGSGGSGATEATAIVFYTVVTIGGSMTLTATHAGGGTGASAIAADEFGGVPAGVAVAGSAGQGNSIGSTSPSTGNITVTANNLVYAACATSSSASSYSPSSGFALSGYTFPASGNDAVAAEYLMGTSTSPQDPGFTLGSSSVWGMAGASFGGSSKGNPAALLPAM